MASEHETVREVCAGMTDATMRVGAFFTPTIYGWRDRIIAAHERDIERMTVAHNAHLDTMESRIAEMVEIVAAKDAEIARLNDELFAYAGGHVITGAERCQREKIRQLEAALEPVLKCNTMDAAFGLDNALFAVREAQRIAKEVKV